MANSEGGSEIKSDEIRVARCPLCGKAREMQYRPFCSARCANVDLSRWFNGVYAAPAKVEEEDNFDLEPTMGAGRREDLS